jgi:hypothetical protein
MRALANKPAAAATPPWARPESQTPALPGLPSEQGRGRTPAQIEADNAAGFARCRPQWARQSAATAGATAKLPKAFILELLATSGIVQCDWQAGKLCEIDNVVRVRQALEAVAAATNPETQRAQLERAIYKSKQLRIASRACDLAIAKVVADFGIVDPDAVVGLSDPETPNGELS